MSHPSISLALELSWSENGIAQTEQPFNVSKRNPHGAGLSPIGTHAVRLSIQSKPILNWHPTHNLKQFTQTIQPESVSGTGTFEESTNLVDWAVTARDLAPGNQHPFATPLDKSIKFYRAIEETH